MTQIWIISSLFDAKITIWLPLKLLLPVVANTVDAVLFNKLAFDAKLELSDAVIPATSICPDAVFSVTTGLEFANNVEPDVLNTVSPM